LAFALSRARRRQLIDLWGDHAVLRRWSSNRAEREVYPTNPTNGAASATKQSMARVTVRRNIHRLVSAGAPKSDQPVRAAQQAAPRCSVGGAAGLSAIRWRWSAFRVREPMLRVVMSTSSINALARRTIESTIHFLVRVVTLTHPMRANA
jgi:hypothetical protein